MLRLSSPTLLEEASAYRPFLRQGVILGVKDMHQTQPVDAEAFSAFRKEVAKAMTCHLQKYRFDLGDATLQELGELPIGSVFSLRRLQQVLTCRLRLALCIAIREQESGFGADHMIELAELKQAAVDSGNLQAAKNYNHILNGLRRRNCSGILLQNVSRAVVRDNQLEKVISHLSATRPFRLVKGNIEEWLTTEDPKATNALRTYAYPIGGIHPNGHLCRWSYSPN